MSDDLLDGLSDLDAKPYRQKKPRAVILDAGALRWAENMGQAAAILKVSAQSLKAAKASGCPGFRNGRVNLPEVRNWIATQELPERPTDPNGLEPKEILERRKLKAQHLKEEFKLQVAQGLYVPIEDVKRDHLRIGAATRAELARFIGDLPNMAGLPAAEIHARGQKWLKEICASLSDKTSKLYKQ